MQTITLDLSTAANNQRLDLAGSAFRVVAGSSGALITLGLSQSPSEQLVFGVAMGSRGRAFNHLFASWAAQANKSITIAVYGQVQNDAGGDQIMFGRVNTPPADTTTYSVPVDLFPAMASNSQDGYSVSETHYFSSGGVDYRAWRTLRGNVNAGVQSFISNPGSGACVITFTLPAAKTLTVYGFRAVSTTAIDQQLEGSNDGANWETLWQNVGAWIPITAKNSCWREWTFYNNRHSFSRYRLTLDNYKDNAGGTTNYTDISNITLKGY
jgi:hypothetical protein